MRRHCPEHHVRATESCCDSTSMDLRKLGNIPLNAILFLHQAKLLSRAKSSIGTRKGVVSFKCLVGNRLLGSQISADQS